MKNLSKQKSPVKLWNPLDLQFAKILITSVFNSKTHHINNITNIEKTVLLLASTYLSAYVRLGHTCLPIHILTSDKLHQHYYPPLLLSNFKILQEIKKLSIDDWQEILLSLSAVGNGSYTSPLVLDNNHLYLYRIWQDECTIAKFFNSSYNHFNRYPSTKIIHIIQQLFPETSSKQVNWHKIATILSFIHSRVLISGGPGTGKTSTIAKIITALLLYDHNLRIKMIAPTGKSASILTYSCNNKLNNFNQLNGFFKYKLELKATTVHSVIEHFFIQQKTLTNYSNTLDIDYLIIDESSMLSVSMLSQLIKILPIHVTVIFSGDHHQLYSIEPGSIFRDVCQFSNFQYSIKRQKELIQLTQYPDNIFSNANLNSAKNCFYNNISDGICILNQNYRFNKNSGIGQLSSAINLGDYTRTLSILNSKKYTDLSYIHLKNEKDYITMIKRCSNKYYHYLKNLQYKKIFSINTLKIFDQYRILCAFKHGIFGVIKLNYFIEQTLTQCGLITLNKSNNYIGRPIIILHNEPSLELCNGDTGILLPDAQNHLSAYFLLPNNEIKIIKINQLPAHETCFAMTIHKAQGSSFLNTDIILPNEHSTILTRELLYTAVTRAQLKLTLYATDNVLIRTVSAATQRYSGLFNRIKKACIHY
ncbi:exodeoxyribonuclease V, alpha subunit [Candidatus Blochmanniella vafra str. BVAF]|uniref:RecBCD enzyme subunit RecD n=1 Tax=Blochmanniella vafra (strain BVAF) TaxID=859654 RepID=E8Q652_BLOVB|nr:exodeoxyribonuclease V subunit alpha [Candidatus Blochmannia vafer]ADV33668.1 exodeoxyribonuclease V, alpha subunit [Candidatus Blochmannia vafer str. BVAF]